MESLPKIERRSRIMVWAGSLALAIGASSFVIAAHQFATADGQETVTENGLTENPAEERGKSFFLAGAGIFYGGVATLTAFAPHEVDATPISEGPIRLIY